MVTPPNQEAVRESGQRMQQTEHFKDLLTEVALASEDRGDQGRLERLLVQIRQEFLQGERHSAPAAVHRIGPPYIPIASDFMKERDLSRTSPPDAGRLMTSASESSIPMIRCASSDVHRTISCTSNLSATFSTLPRQVSAGFPAVVLSSSTPGASSAAGIASVPHACARSGPSTPMLMSSLSSERLASYESSLQVRSYEPSLIPSRSFDRLRSPTPQRQRGGRSPSPVPVGIRSPQPDAVTMMRPSPSTMTPSRHGRLRYIGSQIRMRSPPRSHAAMGVFTPTSPIATGPLAATPLSSNTSCNLTGNSWT